MYFLNKRFYKLHLNLFQNIFSSNFYSFYDDVASNSQRCSPIRCPRWTHVCMKLSNPAMTSFEFSYPYRFWVRFAFATDLRPFLLLFQYVRALFEWGQPLPIRPGASLTSADLIEYTAWVKLKQAEIALPWQPHYSTLRTHFAMHFDFELDKWWKGESNKCTDFGRLLLKKCCGSKYYSSGCVFNSLTNKGKGFVLLCVR